MVIPVWFKILEVPVLVKVAVVPARGVVREVCVLLIDTLCPPRTVTPRVLAPGLNKPVLVSLVKYKLGAAIDPLVSPTTPENVVPALPVYPF
jgi:hypothetical protein